jgi:uncharacterized protein (TIGR02444 family)
MTEDPGSLIEYALAFYAGENVAETLVSLQDRFGADVNIMLYAAWLGKAKTAPASERTIRTADATVAEWRQSVIVPLRNVRRALKAIRRGSWEPDEAIRESVKQIEIKAELAELSKLASLPIQPAAGHPVGQLILANLRSALRFYSGATVNAETEKSLRHLAWMAERVEVRRKRSDR